MSKKILFIIILLFFISTSCKKDSVDEIKDDEIVEEEIVEESLSNNCSYEWYLDQKTTGTYSLINCGPSSSVMAMKWSNPSFSDTPEIARSKYRSTGGWWYTNDIISYFNENSIPNHTISLGSAYNQTADLIINELKDNNILILCIDMYYVRKEVDATKRIDKFYNTANTDWGHFFVVKGYKKVDGEFFFEIYDPYSIGIKYSDNTFKGKDRFYRDEDVFTASNIWWNYAIVVSKKGSSAVSQADRYSSSKHIDINTIPKQKGR